MTRFLVLVEIDADDPVHAEARVGMGLVRAEVAGRPFVRQTQVKCATSGPEEPRRG